jgi:Outer membrane lipoprotein carrier protein LolA
VQGALGLEQKYAPRSPTAETRRVHLPEENAGRKSCRKTQAQVPREQCCARRRTRSANGARFLHRTGPGINDTDSQTLPRQGSPHTKPTGPAPTTIASKTVLITFPFASEFTYGCKPWRGLRRAQSHPASAGAEALRARQTGLLKQPLKNEGRIWATLPDKIRREINGTTPSATVIDGNSMVVYYPNLKEEEVYDLEKRPMLKDSLQAITAGLDLQQLNNYYYVQASKEGAEYQITLTPKTAAVFKIVKWVTVTVNQNLCSSRSYTRFNVSTHPTPGHKCYAPTRSGWSRILAR